MISTHSIYIRMNQKFIGINIDKNPSNSQNEVFNIIGVIFGHAWTHKFWRFVILFIQFTYIHFSKSIKLLFCVSFICADCASCYDIILSTAMNCKGYADIVTCIKDTLGESDPCFDCICEVIDDIGEIFGHDWHCW